MFDEPLLAPAVQKGMGRALAGGGAKENRQANDFYPTPAAVTRAFLREEMATLALENTPIWEPCARGGAMLREIRAAGFDAIGTDIVADPDNGVEIADATTCERRSPRAITNLPFGISAEIILHMLGKLELTYFASVLKSQYWHAENRTALFAAHPPARIYALNWRPDFLNKGAPTMDCIWTVWDARHAGPTEFRILQREPAQEKFL